MSRDKLSPELMEFFAQGEPIEEKDQEALRRDFERIMEKPSFRAGVIKDQFIHTVLEAMEEAGMTSSHLARRWGKTRQYLSKVLKEDRRVNYTVDTMVELMHHLERNVEVHYPRKGEHTMVISCLRDEPVRPAAWGGAGRKSVPQVARGFNKASKPSKIQNFDHEFA